MRQPKLAHVFGFFDYARTNTFVLFYEFDALGKERGRHSRDRGNKARSYVAANAD
jgi:hypothetical protein